MNFSPLDFVQSFAHFWRGGALGSQLGQSSFCKNIEHGNPDARSLNSVPGYVSMLGRHVGSCVVQRVESLKGFSGKICPREVLSLITRGTSHRQIFQTIPKENHCLSDFGLHKQRRCGETVGSNLQKSDRQSP